MSFPVSLLFYLILEYFGDASKEGLLQLQTVKNPGKKAGSQGEENQELHKEKHN